MAGGLILIIAALVIWTHFWFVLTFKKLFKCVFAQTNEGAEAMGCWEEL